MYFHDRAQAGDLLSNQLSEYAYDRCAVVALSTGGLQVGQKIAANLHCSLSLLITSRISAPGDPALVLGTIDQEGEFSYNNLIPAGEMEEYMQDMRTYLEEEKLRRIYSMTTMLGSGGIIDRDNLQDHAIILATDGVKNGLSFDAALHFLKPIRTKRIIAAIPVGPGEVIDRVGRMVDELYYIYTPDNFFHVGHYYENNAKLDSEVIMTMINRTADLEHRS